VVLTAYKDASDFYCKSYIFLKRVRKVIESEEKCGDITSKIGGK